MRAFIDTGGFAALYNSKDHFHAASRLLWKHMTHERWTLFTSNYVVAETIVLLRVRAGHAAAVRFGDDVRSSAIVRTLSINAGHEARAWDIFKKFHDQEFSFTDCTSFAVMQELKIVNVLGYDKHFSVMGFRLLSSAH